MGSFRPLLWLALGFAVAPMTYLALGILSIGSAHPIDFPVAGVATFCLYLFVADLGWTVFRRVPVIGVLAATAAVVLLGYGVPAAVNATMSGKSDRIAAADTVPVTIGMPQVIALLTPYQQTRDKWQVETDCEILCQRLLYRGNRTAVLMGATPASGNPADAVGLVRYSIEQRPSCPSVKVPQASTMPGQMQRGSPDTTTSDTVEARISGGDCLIVRPGSIADADVVAMKSEPNSEAWLNAGGSVGPVATWRSDVFRRSGATWTKIGQATDRRFSRVRSPLRLTQNGLFPTMLASDEGNAAPADLYMIEHLLAPWLGWPEGMPGGSSGPPLPGPTSGPRN